MHPSCKPLQKRVYSRLLDDEKRYLDLHLIPNNPELWTLDRFDDFVEARKLLIQEKFKFMLREVTV